MKELLPSNVEKEMRVIHLLLLKKMILGEKGVIGGYGYLQPP